MLVSLDKVRWFSPLKVTFPSINKEAKFKDIVVFDEILEGIVICSTLGIDIVTAGLSVYKASFEHPFTNKGLKIFQDAWDETEGN